MKTCLFAYFEDQICFIPCNDDEIVVYALLHDEYRVIKLEDVLQKYRRLESKGFGFDELGLDTLRKLKEHLEKNGFERLSRVDCFRVMDFVD